MQNLEVIKLFFSKMKCTNCENNFSQDDISILRSEDNYTVVRIHCKNCDKHLGLAILGLDKECMSKSLQEIEKNNELPVDNEAPPIDYDDVLNAREFIQSLEDDWLKFIPSEYK